MAHRALAMDLKTFGSVAGPQTTTGSVNPSDPHFGGLQLVDADVHVKVNARLPVQRSPFDERQPIGVSQKQIISKPSLKILAGLIHSASRTSSSEPGRSARMTCALGGRPSPECSYTSYNASNAEPLCCNSGTDSLGSCSGPSDTTTGRKRAPARASRLMSAPDGSASPDVTPSGPRRSFQGEDKVSSWLRNNSSSAAEVESLAGLTHSRGDSAAGVSDDPASVLAAVLTIHRNQADRSSPCVEEELMAARAITRAALASKAAHQPHGASSQPISSSYRGGLVPSWHMQQLEDRLLRSSRSSIPGKVASSASLGSLLYSNSSGRSAGESGPRRAAAPGERRRPRRSSAARTEHQGNPCRTALWSSSGVVSDRTYCGGEGMSPGVCSSNGSRGPTYTLWPNGRARAGLSRTGSGLAA